MKHDGYPSFDTPNRRKDRSARKRSMIARKARTIPGQIVIGLLVTLIWSGVTCTANHVDIRCRVDAEKSCTVRFV